MRVFVLLLILCVFLAGCQLPMANYMRDEVFPQKTATKIALSPILLPTYVVLSVVDVVVVNPVRGAGNVPDAVKYLWGWENKTPWLGLGVLLPVKLIATPPAALGTAVVSEQFALRENKGLYGGHTRKKE